MSIFTQQWCLFSFCRWMSLQFFLLLLRFLLIPLTFPLPPSSDIEKSNHWNKHNEAWIVVRFIVSMACFKGKQLKPDAEAVQHDIDHEKSHDHEHRCWNNRADSLEDMRFVDWGIVELFPTGHQQRPAEECSVVSWIEAMPECWDYISRILRDSCALRAFLELFFRVNSKVNVFLQPDLYRAVPAFNFVSHVIRELHWRHARYYSVPFVLPMFSLSIICRTFWIKDLQRLVLNFWEKQISKMYVFYELICTCCSKASLWETPSSVIFRSE